MDKDKIREILIANGVDYEVTIERFANNLDMYIKFLNKFCDDKNFIALQESVKNKDFKNMLTHVHTLKGITGNLGLTKLYNICSDMTYQLRTDKGEQAMILAVDLEKEYANITQAINDVMGVYNA